MGGVNHQPCNRGGAYLLTSTRMSREFTAGRAAFEQANVCLEDTIIAELEGAAGHSFFVASLAQLSIAETHLARAIALTHVLEEKMRQTGYTPLPAFALYREPAKMAKLRTDLVEAGFVKAEAFHDVFTPQLTNGFYGALTLLRDIITQVKDSVHILHGDMTQAVGLAEAGTLTDELENNGALNFRARFMQTYALWAIAFDLFLASAALSTELWYESTGVGTLIEDTRGSRQAVA